MPNILHLQIESGDESSAWDTTEADKIQVPGVFATAKAGGTAQRADSVSFLICEIYIHMCGGLRKPVACRKSNF